MFKFFKILETLCKGFFAILFTILLVAIATNPIGLAFLILWGACSKNCKNESKKEVQSNVVSTMYISLPSYKIPKRKKFNWQQMVDKIWEEITKPRTLVKPRGSKLKMKKAIMYNDKGNKFEINI